MPFSWLVVSCAHLSASPEMSRRNSTAPAHALVSQALERACTGACTGWNINAAQTCGAQYAGCITKRVEQFTMVCKAA